jgi:NAD(P)-dependent dehydrogenase (short-subunit alcohol dehydrogenase family)
MNSLDGKVAIVTGGTRGIGKALARTLLEQDCSVVICSRSEKDVNESVRQLSQAATGRIAGHRCNVGDPDQVQSLVDLAASRFGGVDILINNAGVGLFADVREITTKQWKEVIDTNLSGVFYCCRSVIPHLKKRGGGYIVNISSLAGKNPFKGGSAYNASKFGLNGFSEAIMQDLRYDNIRVSYVMPGSVNTRFGRGTDSGDSAWKLSPEDVAQAVVDLLRHEPRCLPSCVEMRPAKPPKKG